MQEQKFDKYFTNKCLRFAVRFYQTCLGPLLGPSCRYYPTCSHYALEALEKKSAFTAASLILRRLLSCHPFGGQGYDPVP